MTATLYCGIDLHSSNGVYFVTDEQDKPLFKKRLPNSLPVILDALEAFRKDLKLVAVESTYNWYWLVDSLSEHGYPVCLANPSAIKQYDGLKQANDWTDAAFLAHLGRLGILPTGYIYPKEDRPVRDLLRRRMLLVKHRTAMILSLQNLFSRQGIKGFSWDKLIQLQHEQLCHALAKDASLVFVAKEQISVIGFLSQHIQKFEKRALEQAKVKDVYKLLLTMPGVGPILALTILYETGDIERFSSPGNYSSYCRCVRARRLSNDKTKGYNNRKNGNRYLAWAYVEAVHHAIRYCPEARKFYDRKRAQTNVALATKALASKWSKAAYYILKRQEVFDIAKVFG
jgi:transposase